MKICLLARYFDFRNAGLGRVAQEVYKGLQAKGHEVSRVSTNGNSLYSYLWYTLAGIKSQIPNNCDVYHALSPMESLRTPKEKAIVTFNDLIPLTHPGRSGAGLGRSKPKLLIGRNYFRLACEVAKHRKLLVCISEQTKQDLVKHLGVEEGRIKVIKLGINSNLEPTTKSNGLFTVGYLGQLDRRKRVDLLVKEFKNSHVEGRLLIAGTGTDEALLRRLAEGDHRIKFLGFVPDKDLPHFYGSLDVFVFPTWIEGYGLPIVEAMACKKPVVVMKDAIIPHEVKSRCTVVDDLGQVFSRALDYADLNDNYEWAKTHNWEKCIDEYIKLYELL